jgi:RNA exonuclease 4
MFRRYFRTVRNLFSEVQAQLVELLRDRIVIGHDIQKDLKVISMDLPCYTQRLE